MFPLLPIDKASCGILLMRHCELHPEIQANAALVNVQHQSSHQVKFTFAFLAHHATRHILNILIIAPNDSQTTPQSYAIFMGLGFRV